MIHSFVGAGTGTGDHHAGAEENPVGGNKRKSQSTNSNSPKKPHRVIEAAEM